MGQGNLIGIGAIIASIHDTRVLGQQITSIKGFICFVFLELSTQNLKFGSAICPMQSVSCITNFHGGLLTKIHVRPSTSIVNISKTNVGGDLCWQIRENFIVIKDM
jgi:hypothetical protein